MIPNSACRFAQHSKLPQTTSQRSIIKSMLCTTGWSSQALPGRHDFILCGNNPNNSLGIIIEAGNKAGIDINVTSIGSTALDMAVRTKNVHL